MSDEIEDTGALHHQQELEHQEQEKLFAALAKAQAEIVGAKKDSENPFFKSNYADLAACWDACRDALTRNGLCVIQLPQRSAPETVTLQTILAHESGQSVSSTFTMPMREDSPQAYGSTLTYARRYALSAIVGLAQVDDDGEGAMNRNPPPPRLITARQRSEIEGLLPDAEETDLFCKWAKIERVEQLPASKYSRSLKRLQERENERVSGTDGE